MALTRLIPEDVQRGGSDQNSRGPFVPKFPKGVRAVEIFLVAV